MQPFGKTMTVGIQGSNGSYSELAAFEYFACPNGAMMKVIPSVINFDHSEQVCEALNNKQIDFAFFPVENSIIGNIAINMDLLNQYPFYVIGEHYLKIEHCLLALPTTLPADIKKVYSHPAALEQCRDYLLKFNLASSPSFDTAGAAKTVRPGEAVIASRRTAELYNLHIIDTNIQKVRNNFTRFFLICHVDNKLALLNDDKTSLAFTIGDGPGSLLRCLEKFAQYGLNLTKLESRPIPDNPFMYTFFVDLESSLQSEEMQGCLRDLKLEAQTIKILGSYPAGHKQI
ncbi:MAG: bifunctional chorismate mutase/prephenate dehydratase [Bdellovibrio sp.]|nr:bifunctional chorismate mutase/prephenate dehydratase [Bdellovibrio sp.]